MLEARVVMQVHGTRPEPKAPGPPSMAHPCMATVAAGSTGVPGRRGRPPKCGREDEDDVIYAADGAEDEDEDAGASGANRWSGVNRAERYRRRHGDESDAGQCSETRSATLAACLWK